MEIITTPDVYSIFSKYPVHVNEKLQFLRKLILDTASETESIDKITETLKWGEPGYITDGGSTVRIGWKKSSPDQYAMYFNCKTRLVDTFKERYKNTFSYEGNRAIIFYMDNNIIPVNEVKHCIELSLTYHSRKHLPMLGI